MKLNKIEILRNESLNLKKPYNYYTNLIKEGLNLNRQGYKAEIGIIGLNKFYNTEITRTFLNNFLQMSEEIKEKENILINEQFLNILEQDGLKEIARKNLIVVLKSQIKPLKSKRTAKISSFLRNYDFKTIPVLREELNQVLDSKRIYCNIFTRENPNKEKSKYPKKALLSYFPNVANWQGEKFYFSSYDFKIGKEYIFNKLITEKLILKSDDSRIKKFRKYNIKSQTIKANPKILNINSAIYPTLKDEFGHNAKIKTPEEIFKAMGKYDAYRVSQGLSLEEVETLNQIK